ncbi:helix-turn-helix domain-containing protein [Megasphaera elsdenii]|jgi:transcriptional regulator with XRE-family HTH domain|uniref:helix-turn-helix domain-containing protein n=1 Tax=Megasphaera TaxID=906 RepID=UPI001D01768E|nr:helix-turn-helix transcriptional regulator [Megasphaera elsdenii]MCB5703235.1 helix-turn-helix domain-containing protein [Megasphaera elsdenii]MCB5728011.1 helix-turn-helix domain-containing protein [Megasphaera elsdenii]MCB5771788.1 helix-turn-helix domain-containing protein [Megasphaera elsdenii]
MRLSLIQARKLRGKRQIDLAKVLGINIQTYRKLEKKPDLLKIKDLRILSKYLDIPMEKFLLVAKDDEK